MDTNKPLNDQVELKVPPPMTDAQVSEEMKKLGRLNSTEVKKICEGYANLVKQLVKNIKNKLNKRKDLDEIIQVEQLMRLISLCPSEEIFIRSKDKIWFARKFILEKNAEWFLNRNYSENIKRDQKQRMIETLVRMVQIKWKNMNEDERNEYWTKAAELLKIVLDFNNLTSTNK